MPSTIQVDNKGTVLAYLDSGIPPNSPKSYNTIFALHGLGFASRKSPKKLSCTNLIRLINALDIYKRIMALAPAHNLRIIAINRRGYPGSTPFSESESAIFASGTDQEKANLLQQLGIEINVFIYNFIRKFGLPALSEDTREGGFAVMGWSLGTIFAIETVAVWDALPEEVARRLKNEMRGLILHGMFNYLNRCLS